jgi:hypothetical protein
MTIKAYISQDRKLGDLSEVISTTYTSNMNNTASVSVDLARIRDILDICPHLSNRPTPVSNDEDPVPGSAVPNGLSPPQWVRLSRRPSVDQPDEGAPLPQIDEQTRPQDFIMPPQTSVGTTNPTLHCRSKIWPLQLKFRGSQRTCSSTASRKTLLAGGTRLKHTTLTALAFESCSSS